MHYFISLNRFERQPTYEQNYFLRHYEYQLLLVVTDE